MTGRSGRHRGEHGGDGVAGDGAIAVDRADHGHGRAWQADLLLRFAQRRLDDRLAGIEPAAGKRDLAGVAAQRVGALGEDDAGARPVGDRDQYRGGGERILRPLIQPDLVAGQQVGRGVLPARERGGEPLGQGHAGWIGKNAPALHTPGGCSSPASARSARS